MIVNLTKTQVYFDRCRDTREIFEQALVQQENSGITCVFSSPARAPRSTQAIANTRKILDTYLADRYELEVIDLYQHPEAAEGMLVIAAPTLVKLFPLPFKWLIGDMSNREKVLLGLGLTGAGEEGSP